MSKELTPTESRHNADLRPMVDLAVRGGLNLVEQSCMVASMSGREQFDSQPAPKAERSSPERVTQAWRAWLSALATDAEAALGASLAYEALDPEGRDAFVRAVEDDLDRLDVPRIAVFAPFLSVEKDPERSANLKALMGQVTVEGSGETRAFVGNALTMRVVVVQVPAYLSFVRVTSCGLTPGHCIHWVHHDPLLHRRDTTKAGELMKGACLEQVPLSVAVDEIANALVAQRRRGLELPDSLLPLLDLFDLRLSGA